MAFSSYRKWRIEERKNWSTWRRYGRKARFYELKEMRLAHASAPNLYLCMIVGDS